MVQVKKINILAVTTIFAAVAVLISLQHIFAAAGSLYISPTSSSLQNGSSVKVSVRLNPGVSVDGVEARLTYDASKLEFVSIDPASSAFEVALGAQSGSNGTVSITRGTFSGGVTSDSLVARVTFKALAGSGSTPITLSGNATTGGTYTNPGTAGTTISLTSPSTPTPTPTPTPSPTSPSTPAPAPSTPGSTDTGNETNTNQDNTPTPTTETPTATKPQVQIEKDNIQFTKVGIVIKSTTPTKVYVVYGIGDKFDLQTPQTELGIDHTVALDPTKLDPGTTYKYKVVSENEAGVVAESEAKTIKTKGYTLRVTIVGKDGLPLKKKKVTIFSEPQTSQTDRSGVVTFKDLAAGNHTIQYEQDSKQYKKTVLVDDNVKTSESGEQVAGVQNAAVLYEDLVVPKGTNTVAIATLLAVLALLAALFVAFKKGLFQRSRNQSVIVGGGPAAAPTQTIDEATSAQLSQDIFTHEYPKVPAPGATVQPKEKIDDQN